MEEEAEIDRLPMDLLAQIFVFISSFTDLAQASSVCKKWKRGVKRSLARRESLSFAGCKMDDETIARLIRHAYSLKDIDISKSRWGCQITDKGLYRISLAKCVSNLTSISLWGMTGVTDKGVVQLTLVLWSCRHVTENGLLVLVNKCRKLESINVWGTRVPVGCFMGLLTIHPGLMIKI
ncbi:hypothetical protein I3843_01G015800 [Carya illinoinensis]|uniref:F-box domain-containing protein n=1 Tax=Carya illinoinensis TaxID=32201 RepID=A0A8T1RHV0_CARIL|nr:F-box protein At5g67140 isoform X2 [Carya illinoinensis]KAG2724391.1 hypothetical protein I3760_01G014800 [Carya illinoinensis]KAG6666225.1 hypothetical protein CIPAW_01G016200 [Carya illinoinensis]KAG6729198.1 hypothetical protein I3842_01G014800 [Carya illinoinensis]KAG6729199.1 hypothetical protein I3842_01G014800 [Carya illinoinensis]KAG7993660.1 hypothetical protein I3843_01G015800 [Carya illinoinensis]